MLVAQAALIRAAQHHGVRRAVTFHHKVADAAEFPRTLPAAVRRLAPRLPVPDTAHVHGGMDHGLRDEILDSLRNPHPGTWSTVSNARCLGEGTDIPAIDAVLFAHPKTSGVDIVQAVGRALRPHPDAPGDSTVIVPITVPEEDGEIGDLDAGAYTTLWQIVRALRAHDEPLGIALDTSRAHLHSTDDPPIPAKITVELPAGAADRLLAQVQLLMVRQVTSPGGRDTATPPPTENSTTTSTSPPSTSPTPATGSAGGSSTPASTTARAGCPPTASPPWTGSA